VELQRTAEVSRQTCHNRWRPWWREFVASGAAGRWFTPEVFDIRRRCHAMRPVRCRMVVQ
jgi:hypothetical protein